LKGKGVQFSGCFERETMDRDQNRENQAMNPARREFVARIAGAGAVAAMLPGELLAQDKPKPADPAGTVSNESALAEKAAGFSTHSDRPLTWSIPAEHHNYAVTPNDRMFIRNNHLTPDLSESSHRLTVKGLVDKELSFSVAELKKAFPAVTMQGMMECAGSGRSSYVPPASGTRWLPTGGMGCPNWTGVRLRDVLAAAGVKSNGAHVSGQGGDFGVVATAAPVIRSIPMAKAMDSDTLIAWGMNDGPLPKVHGFPLRLVVPGWVGSASTKWLHTLTVLDAPFKGTYMDSSYRIPRHPVKPGDRMPKDAVSTEAWPVKSMITHPAPNAVFKAGKPVLVEGRAWARAISTASRFPSMKDAAGSAPRSTPVATSTPGASSASSTRRRRRALPPCWRARPTTAATCSRSCRRGTRSVTSGTRSIAWDSLSKRKSSYLPPRRQDRQEKQY
jgi:DMSO/TMAO reductase YedYZ molybdopterin-dependent catalytic subunit